MGRVRKRPTYIRTRNKRTKPNGLSWRVIKAHNRKRKPSNLEVIVSNWLKEDGIKFKREKAIGHCHVDFFISPRTIIEVQGCYYHRHELCRPIKEKDTEAQIIRLKDLRRFKFLRSRGYDIIAIWGCEIENEPERVRATLRALAKKA